jgi:putative nucleotidyltransferase with HDIG domain
MSDHRRLQLCDDLLRRFAGALRGAQLYSRTHPLVARNVKGFAEALTLAIGPQRSITIGVVAGEFVVGDLPLPRATATMGDLRRKLEKAGVERITFQRDVDVDEVKRLIDALAGAENGAPALETLAALAHIEVGRIQLQQRVEAPLADREAVRRIYGDATSAAEALWEMAKTEGIPDPSQMRAVVDTLAQAVAQSRSALLALTALEQKDTYTFTHMVNVSILTMAQARATGIDGPLLRELGMAGLMHDIGKVRTPDDILKKPDRLTEQEFEVMKRHVIDGAEILRSMPDTPALVPIVALEHHLRIDGSGYPVGVRRPALNLATQLCGIADVYDAMRSQRRYQRASPTDRILAVLQHNDGSQFDARLVRRFVQILGIYPVGTLVRLDTGERAVVVRTNASDPYRPEVRVVTDALGRPLGRPYELPLWEQQEGSGRPASIVAPLGQSEPGLEHLAAVEAQAGA